ncbi:hypothetical protein FDENT_12690 [Fusarium denticulatum]|uniref:Uncharacterized protein n=1 Tax=Fusarium denticulatum TaxID=48507 RepID=A0A8H5T9E8_9HYPO|nr:hypothetical protein FDENT_12690 [Fusarium denticulatum]
MAAQKRLDPILDSILAIINEWVADCSQISTDFEAQSSPYANKLHALNKGAQTIQSLVRTLVDNSANDSENEPDPRIDLPAGKNSTEKATLNEQQEISQEPRSREDAPMGVAIFSNEVTTISASETATLVPRSLRGKSGDVNAQATSHTTPTTTNTVEEERTDMTPGVNNVIEANTAAVDQSDSTDHEDIPIVDAEPPTAQPLAVVTTAHPDDRPPTTPTTDLLPPRLCAG